MRLEIDTTVSASHLADNASRQAGVDPAEARSALTQGIKAAQAGDRSQARVALTKATQLDPRNESAWLWLASISEYPEELLGFLNHVLDINPENQRATEWKKATHALLSKTFVQRGIDAVEENKKEFAAECFRTALDYNDQNAAAWVWMASMTDSNADKISMLERALSSEPANQSAVAALETARKNAVKQKLSEAKAAAIAGNSGVAISIVDALLQVDPDIVDAWMLKSHLSDSFDEKIRCFESILRIDPTNVAARASRDSLLTILESVEEPAVDEPNEPASFSSAEPTVFESEDIPETDTMSSLEESAPHTGPASSDLEPEYSFIPEVVPSWNEPETSTESERDDVADTNYEKEEFNNAAEPFASFAEETAEFASKTTGSSGQLDSETSVPEYVISGDSHPYSQSDQTVAEESSYADPQSQTVAFEYDASAHLSFPGNTNESCDDESNPYELGAQSAQPGSAPDTDCETIVESSPETFLEHLTVRAESIHCPFCGQTNDPQAISCSSCTAVLTLSDLELLLSSQDSNKPILRQAVDNMERERSIRNFTPDELVTLGLGHLNLRNLQFGYDCLMEASKLSPNNVVLTGQVNSLLIRLDEIRRKEEAHLKMPKGKSILIVDDSPTVLKLIAGKLEKCGHEVVCANDGVEALDRLENYVPDLVLLDITMPRMDGYHVCKQIRSTPATKDVAVIMISGKDGFFDKVRGRMAGATGYITKPFGPETLMKTVEMYLSGEAPQLEEV